MNSRDNRQSIEDEFFQTLAGKTRKQNSALVLREIIKDQVEIDQAIKRHEEAAVTINAESQIRDIKKKLYDNQSNLNQSGSWFQKLSDSVSRLLSSLNTIETIGAFASISFAVVGAIFFINNTGNNLAIEHYSIQQENNHKTIVIATQNTSTLVKILESELTAINIEYAIEKLDQDEWLLELKPKTEQEIIKTNKILESVDTDVLNDPPYFLYIKKLNH